MSDPRPGRQTGYTPAGFRSDEPGTRRPSRPAAVELAAAIVIVTGIVSTLQSIEVYARLAQDGGDVAALAAASIVVGLVSVLIGVLLRYGRAWLVGVNLLVIAGFLELISGTPIGIVSGLLDVLVVVILMANRPWFAWRPGAGGEPDLEPDAEAERRT